MDEETRKQLNETAARQMAINLIKQLADLHKEGILTDEEFDAKKQDLLSRL